MSSTVLIVDDIDLNRELLSDFLDLLGYRAITASNGQEALDTFMGPNIALILIDLEMPVKNGFEATAEIRKLPNGDAVPIIALSAHDDPGIIKKCLHVGCNSYLTKPLRKNKFIETLKDYLG
ncbi:MAG: response regulator, partial [Nitrospirae bacterium]|nr:response regulator [Nitrospirota bacterium]